MQDAILDKVSKANMKKRPDFAVGDRVSVSVRLKEGDKERIQVYRGVVIEKTPKSGNHSGATFTVRKVSSGVGVERIFPLHSPVIEKIQVESSAQVRRSRLFFLRALSGKKARLKEATGFEDLVAKKEEAPAEVINDTTTQETQGSEPPTEGKKS